jgi:hypothetical protein
VPCNLGYRSVARARVETPAPATFEAVTPAPAVDAELLERLGVDDPVFADWLADLDLEPLLARALDRTGPTDGVEAVVRGGALRVRAPSAARAAALTRRWQVEVLRIVGELLGYELGLDWSDAGFVLEGEKAGAAGVAPFLRISGAGADAELRFEHFGSDDELALEEARFVALAQRLGVRLRLLDRRRAGQPIPAGALHRHGKKGRS